MAERGSGIDIRGTKSPPRILRLPPSFSLLFPTSPPQPFPFLLPLFLIAILFLLLFPTAVLFTQLTSYYISKGGSPRRGERDWLLPVASCLSFSYSFHKDVLLVVSDVKVTGAKTKGQLAWGAGARAALLVSWEKLHVKKDVTFNHLLYCLKVQHSHIL